MPVNCVVDVLKFFFGNPSIFFQIMLIPPSANLSSQDQSLVLSLTTELGQQHLFANCPPDHFGEVVNQLREADDVLAPGGLRDYIFRGRKLLAESKSGLNPLDGCEVSVPAGVVLDPTTDEYERLETVGESHVAGLCFVLVAGGLGERLGFPGIKISLPVETQTGITYMDLFAQHILEFQRMAREQTGNGTLELPLAIMTSADTHERTQKLLNDHKYFGLSPGQVTLMMQGKVPCFDTSEARLAIDSSNKLDMKPHGHGDVHGLLLQTGLAQKWKNEERKWLFFFQDTNSLSMRSLCACLGASVQHNFAMNSLSVPRAPGEASGGICRLRFKDGRDITASVEYNMLGPLLAPQGGDVAGPTGDSPYPGNCNILLFDLGRYTTALVKSKGVVPEFVNPKYTDGTKTAFKSPTRLECLMQDFALLLEGEPVGFCSMPRWLTFSVVKNSNTEAKNKLNAGQPMDGALSGECEFFDSNCRFLSIAANRAGFGAIGFNEKSYFEFHGVKHALGPRVTLLPSFGATIRCMKDKIKGDIALRGGPSTALVIGGHSTVISNLDLEGAAIINNCHVKDKKITNQGWELVPVPDVQAVEPAIAIRGFIVKKNVTERLD